MTLNPNKLGTVYKTAAEAIDLSVDFSAWLDAADTISTATVTCKYGTTDYSSTMVASVVDDNDDEVTWKVQAGTAGTTYLLTITATTTGTDILQALLDLVVN